jgi:hypothetical protein
MALIKFGSIITEASGSLGGQTVQNSKGGFQLKNKGIPHNRRSAEQLFIRSINKRLHGTWRNLSDEQRAVWNVFAKPAMSGHSKYFQLNYIRAYNGLSLYITPYLFDSGYGPELVTGGDFNNPSDWQISNLAWSVHDGVADYEDVFAGYCGQDLTITSGFTYNLRFTITEITGQARIRFAGTPTADIWVGVYGGFQTLSGGNYDVDLECDVDSTSLRVYAGTAGGQFYLDNLSLRQVL